MCNTMQYPETIDEYLNQFSFKDKNREYTNGSDLIQTFRVKQALDHYYKPKENNPLSLDELKERIGKPVWIKETKQWIIIQSLFTMDYTAEEYIDYNIDEDVIDYNCIFTGIRHINYDDEDYTYYDKEVK